MKSFVVSLLIVGAAAMLPQGAQAQQVAQSMPGMEMQKGGGEAKPDTAKTGGMSCCCSKKEETTKKSEQPIR